MTRYEGWTDEALINENCRLEDEIEKIRWVLGAVQDGHGLLVHLARKYEDALLDDGEAAWMQMTSAAREKLDAIRSDGLSVMRHAGGLVRVIDTTEEEMKAGFPPSIRIAVSSTKKP